jgi:cell division protein FtsW
LTAAALPVARLRWQMSPEARALVIVAGALLAFGLAVLYSASAYEAMRAGRHSAHFLVKQLTGAGAGIVLFAFCAKFDAERWRSMAWPMVFVAIAAMIATILPGMEAINGSQRALFNGGVQPSEFAKLAVVIWTAMLVNKKGAEGLRHLSKGILPFLTVIGVLAFTAVVEPDYSAALHFGVLMAVVLYTGGARIGHFVFLSVAAVPVLWMMVLNKEYVRDRVVAFLNPMAAGSQADLFQLTQSLVAAGSGGLLGVGFGEGRQQMGYVMFSFTDFIGSVIAEELGWLGLVAVTALFAAYGYLGFRLAAQARTTFQRLVATGLTVNMVLTAYVHLGVVIGLLPTTGLTLPFISYGRSNLLLSLVTTGILCNIGSQRERVAVAHPTDPLAVAVR